MSHLHEGYAPPLLNIKDLCIILFVLHFPTHHSPPPPASSSSPTPVLLQSVLLLCCITLHTYPVYVSMPCNYSSSSSSSRCTYLEHQRGLTHSLTRPEFFFLHECMDLLSLYLHRHGAQHNSSYRRSGDCSSRHSMCRMRNTLQCFCPLKNSKTTTTTTLFPVRDAIALQFYYYYYIYLAPRV